MENLTLSVLTLARTRVLPFPRLPSRWKMGKDFEVVNWLFGRKTCNTIFHESEICAGYKCEDKSGSPPPLVILTGGGCLSVGGATAHPSALPLSTA